MRSLSDTHIFLWFQRRSPRLSTNALSLIRQQNQQVFISAVSFWEIAIKRRTGKLVYEGSVRDAATDAGFEELAIDAGDAEAAGSLDWDHRDPFDRMLIAQCLNHSLTLITADAAFRVRSDIAIFWVG